MTKRKSGLIIPEPTKLVVPQSNAAYSTAEQALRAEVAKSMTVAGLTTDEKYLSYAGILPLDLPEGTRILIIPDWHIPAHLKSLVWPMLQFGSDYRPHLLLSIGDLADIFGMSRHPKQLRVSNNPQSEFETTRRIWDALVAACDPLHSIIIPGNHEDRIYRFLQELAPLMGGLLDPNTREPFSFHSALGYTKDDNITFVYGTEERGGFDGGVLINNDLSLHHGIVVRPKPGASPLADMDRWMWSIAHGHTHRMGMNGRDVNPSDEYFAGMLRSFELGNLVDPDHSYMSYNKGLANWHPGFAVATVHNGAVHLQMIPIAPGADGRLCFTYAGKTYVEDNR